MYRFLSIFLVGATLGPGAAKAQSHDNVASAVRTEMLYHFNDTGGKMVMLSEAMPEDLYTWSTGEGMMTVGEVYAHIARYNFMYLENQLGIPAPSDIDLDTVEALTDKASIAALLRRSVDHVKRHLPDLDTDQLEGTSTLYGRDVPGWAVLVQLVSHMNEHVGQAVAYARINDVVPPWAN